MGTVAKGPDPVGIGEVRPLLWVADLQRSLDFYVDGWGFEVTERADSTEGPYWCHVRRGGAGLMLQRADPGGGSPDIGHGPIALYFVCDDVDALYREALGRGIDVAPPEDAYYGMRQLRVPDPDGHGVWFETPIESSPE